MTNYYLLIYYLAALEVTDSHLRDPAGDSAITSLVLTPRLVDQIPGEDGLQSTDAPPNTESTPTRLLSPAG